MAPSTIRLGTASPGTQTTKAETLVQLERLARRAAAKKIDILLLPEAYLGGYPRGTHFGCVVGSRSPEGREEYLRYFHGAVDLGDTVGDGAGAGEAWVNRRLPNDVAPASEDGKPGREGITRGDGTREELERIARETGVFLVTGVIEKAGGSLYCAVVYVCPRLGIIGKRRKVMPTGAERLVWAQGSPATLRAVSTTIRGVRINLAAAICWENYMPLVRQALYAQNINLYLAPTADGRDAWLSLLRTTAIEGRCFVVSSNMCVRNATPSQAPPVASVASNTSAIPNGDDADGASPDPDPFSARPATRPASHPRRASCLTEEGFEIALPSSPPQAPPRRRHSIMDENGNEIALPCPPPARTSSRSRETARPRRHSVYDEDGNEIVLCAAKHAPSATSPASAPPASVASTTVPPAPAQTKHQPAFASRGGSAIVSPFGDVLAGPQWEDDEGIIYADVDFEDCIRGRLDLDVAGSYSRNDSFRFEVRGLDLTPLPY
ncbi:uncharacterized protein THITE_2124640 [Thermothielavioides terrestris NRRL 8126]|uniref:CN hydrolase domain-containing protein n=1 Tax=Thermothielavioides terrestris (strain ATCC 38088 / NRRL 8126) TaxID=578455 RepID=G2RG62_THETT|nr:uncharacterized protein THITE_2124640 [Thermothielavioides terrestris NRRL 8126]AEO71805.1 hypothetical protein THITE_2124640 [Thermothielavioides terrestris NRRL 8126]